MDQLHIIRVVTTHHPSYCAILTGARTLPNHPSARIVAHGTEPAKLIMQSGTGAAGSDSSLAEAAIVLVELPYSSKGVHCLLSSTKSMRSSSIHTAAGAGKSQLCVLGVPLILHHVRVLMPEQKCCTRPTRVGAAIVVRTAERDGRARERYPECASEENEEFVSVSRLPHVHPA